MRFFAFATLAPLLALRGASLRSSHKGSSRCPCIEDHSEFDKAKLEHKGSCHSQFGIGCKTHNISASCAVHIYKSDTAAQLTCGSSRLWESPWCETKWCYVDPKNCSMDFALGVLGQAYSYPTCGNLRQGSDKYFKKSLAAFLHGDPLRVLHPEGTLKGGYLGNTACHEHYDAEYLTHQKCKGVVAEFWARSLDELNQSQVQVDHKVIRRGEKGIDQYFIDFDIANQFEEYKRRFPEQWAGWPTTNFDLCAFATGMGYVDLCSGAFSLTHQRQAMTYMIELYTAPVFLVSKSKCDFFASESGEKFWAWWILVFSPGAWAFFLGVVFFFIVAMKCFDYGLNQQPGPPTSGQGCGASVIYACTDALLGVFEALAFQSKTSYRRDSKRPGRSRPSHILRLGLGFFIWLSMAVYGASITANMISAREVKGEVPSLEEAKRRKIPLCTHLVLEESMRPYQVENLTTYSENWEDVLKGLKSGETCSAALLHEESWNTFRSRRELCDFYKEPTAQFYVPAGAVVSKRAYRTLEALRFAPSETGVFFDKSSVHPNLCPANSADALCNNIKEDGVPWYTLFSLFVVAAVCGLVSLCGIAHQRNGGEDAENEEEKEKERKKEEMYRNIARLLRIGEEMTIANIERLFDRGFDRKFSQVLQQAEGAGPAKQDAAEPENQDLEASQGPTGAAPSSPLPTSFRPEFRRDPYQTAGAKWVLEHAQGSADSPCF